MSDCTHPRIALDSKKAYYTRNDTGRVLCCKGMCVECGAEFELEEAEPESGSVVWQMSEDGMLEGRIFDE